MSVYTSLSQRFTGILNLNRKSNNTFVTLAHTLTLEMQAHSWNDKTPKLSWNASPTLIALELSLDIINSQKNPLLELWLHYLGTKVKLEDLEYF